MHQNGPLPGGDGPFIFWQVKLNALKSDIANDRVKLMYDNDDSRAKARRDYHRALRRAFWRKLRYKLGAGCNDLLPTSRVFKYLDLGKRRELGLQDVPLDKIVGSTGRMHDFDLNFLPRRRENDGRWVNVARARYRGSDLSPVVLYKVGDGYLVEDGNHRISVARTRGEETIRAIVIEIDTSALIPEPSCTRLGYKV